MYPEVHHKSGYNHSQSKPPVGRPVAYLLAQLNGTTSLHANAHSTLLLRSKALICLALGVCMIHECLQRATADHPKLAELERMNSSFFRHAPQVLVVVARESDSLPQRHVVFDGVFGTSFVVMRVSHEHSQTPFRSTCGWGNQIKAGHKRAKRLRWACSELSDLREIEGAAIVMRECAVMSAPPG